MGVIGLLEVVVEEVMGVGGGRGCGSEKWLWKRWGELVVEEEEVMEVVVEKD